MILRPLGNWYHLRLTPADDRTEGGVYLPDRAEVQTDALVLAAPPGRALDDGQRYALQAEAGDRVLFRDWCFRQYGAADEGVVRDEDLLAVIPGPEHVEVRPLNDTVMLEVLPWPAVERQNGVLVANYALHGEEVREDRRAQTLLSDCRAMCRTERFRAAGDYDRSRMFRDFVDGIPYRDQLALRELLDRKGAGQGEGWSQYALPVIASRRRDQGTLVAVSSRVPSGRLLGLVVGTLLRFDPYHREVVDAGGYTFVPSAAVLAVEEEE